LSDAAKIKCLVIDDENAAITVLRHFISRVPYLEYLGGYLSPIEGLQAAKEQQVDILFVDVQMPDINGLDLVKNIDRRCQVILTTAYSQYALDGFDLDVTDYLLKPIPFARFLKAVEKAKSQLSLQGPVRPTASKIHDDFLLVKGDVKGKFFKIEYRDIDYIEGRKNYAAIVCGDQKIVSLLNIKDLEERLPAGQFIRVHKSFIVSMAKISSIEGNSILLKDSPHNNIIIGETYKAAFFEIMKNGMIKPGQ
jgi:two-component system, LytTR family, response regulator